MGKTTRSMTLRNAVFLFPPEVRADVDKMLTDQASGAAIHRMLQDKYGKAIKVPCLPTVLSYMAKKRELDSRSESSVISPEAVSQFALGLHELARVADQAKSKNEPNFSKIRILEGLVGKCVLRILAIESTMHAGSKIQPGNEQALVKYISEIKSIIESVIKLSTDLKQDDEEILHLIRAESQAFLKIVKAVVMQVCPEKYEMFKLKLKEGLKTKSVELGIEEEKTYEKHSPTDAEILALAGSLPEMTDTAPVTETITATVAVAVDGIIDETIATSAADVQQCNAEVVSTNSSVQEAGAASINEAVTVEVPITEEV